MKSATLKLDLKNIKIKNKDNKIWWRKSKKKAAFLGFGKGIKNEEIIKKGCAWVVCEGAIKRSRIEGRKTVLEAFWGS